MKKFHPLTLNLADLLKGSHKMCSYQFGDFKVHIIGCLKMSIISQDMSGKLYELFIK